MLLKFPETLPVVARLAGEEILSVLKIERLSMGLLQAGLVVPRVHMAQAAWAKDLDHALGFCDVGRRSHRLRIADCGSRIVSVKQRGKCDAAESTTGAPEEIAARPDVL